MGILGDVLSFGGSLLGVKQARKDSRRDRELSMAQFDAQMDESIQRRVRDAEKAGIHPIFAMGANVGASPTAHYGGGPKRSVGDALAALGSRMSQRDLQEAQLKVMESEANRNEADAAAANAEAARTAQNIAATGRDLAVAEIDMGTLPKARIPEIRVNPDIGRRGKPGQKGYRPPVTIKAYDPQTGKSMNVMNPELGLDELGQIHFVREAARVRRAPKRKSGRKTTQKGRTRRGRQPGRGLRWRAEPK